MAAPSDRKYLTSHEWALEADGLITIGITDVAIAHLSDLVFVDLPAPGKELVQGEPFGEIESVKAVSDLMSPVNGVVEEVHEEISDELDILASDPFDKGWIIKVRPSDNSGMAQLLDADAYNNLVSGEDA
ncbi:MAG: glycine cleavage system protein H [Planctomycetota bacterium]|nr:MAG: glycine cleavage system protein H [Planctomycetota bacterium]